MLTKQSIGPAPIGVGLDPQEVCGSDFPGETFRVLKEKEMKMYGDAAQSGEAARVGEVG